MSVTLHKGLIKWRIREKTVKRVCCKNISKNSFVGRILSVWKHPVVFGMQSSIPVILQKTFVFLSPDFSTTLVNVSLKFITILQREHLKNTIITGSSIEKHKLPNEYRLATYG